ncbi:hypothetical protein CPB83DRAFT_850881 [Crepidotus variabilis]|uniref:Uncharacterized protein n=1 Tax=Crepidotus variabilis TaxID=179855 RepID=A0A9P6EJV4_9AGAR|nr:hypothetical protein CPB83DRAFT_850881 [Crepidotus variabilis]
MDRCSRQVPIQTLGISASYDLDQEDISLLREIVVDVPWDGHRRCYGNVLNEEEEESEVYSGESDSEEGSEDSEDYSHVQIQRSTEDLLFILRNGCM